jgi:hypothetical protein
MDINGDGKLDAKEEDFPLSRLLTLDGKTWLKTHVDGGGMHVNISPCKPEVGVMRLQLNFTGPAEMARGKIELVSDNGCGFVYTFADDETLLLPESVYRFSVGHLTLMEREGKIWTSVFTMLKPVTIKRGEETVVRLGAPMSLKPRVDRWPTLGKRLCVFPGLTGVGGEEYENISPTGTRMRPDVNIVDTEGIVVSKGKMDYG